MPSNAFNVYKPYSHKIIDTVFSTETDAAEVKRSLVNHDGYDPDIRVVKARKSKPKTKPQPVACVASFPEYVAAEWDSYMQYASFYNID